MLNQEKEYMKSVSEWLSAAASGKHKWFLYTYVSTDVGSSKKQESSRKTPAAPAAKSLQSCPTLCNPIDTSPPGYAVPGILQARTLEWVAISFSNAWKWKAKMKLFSGVRLFVTPWTAAYQAPLSMGVSRQEYWSGVPSMASQWQKCISLQDQVISRAQPFLWKIFSNLFC